MFSATSERNARHAYSRDGEQRLSKLTRKHDSAGDPNLRSLPPLTSRLNPMPFSISARRIVVPR